MTQPARDADAKPRTRSRRGCARLDVPLRDAAHRLLLEQYELAARHRQAVLAASQPQALHDLRVSLRRFRAGLRFLRGGLKDTQSRRIELRIAALLDRLGPYRDREVCGRLLQPGAARHAEESAPPRGLATLLTGEPTRRLFVEMGHLAQVTIPALTGTRHRQDFVPFAARRLKRALRRLLDRGILPATATPEQAHRRRKQIRRLRYYAEMCEPALGSRVAGLGCRLKELADALGDVHDVNMFLEHAKRSGGAVEKALDRRLRKNRAAAAARYSGQWEGLAAPSYSWRVIGFLEGLEGMKRR